MVTNHAPQTKNSRNIITDSRTRTDVMGREDRGGEGEGKTAGFRGQVLLRRRDLEPEAVPEP
jgi:hypothetical protein